MSPQLLPAAATWQSTEMSWSGPTLVTYAAALDPVLLARAWLLKISMDGVTVFQFVPRVGESARLKQSVKLHGGGPLLNTAFTVESAVGVNVQVVVLLTQPPLKPPKLDPELGVAVRVIAVPSGKLAEQDVPQLIPAGLETTVPLPVPDGATVVVWGGAPVPRIQFSSWPRAVSSRSANPAGSWFG